MVCVWFWLVGIKFGFFICFLYCWFRFDYVGLYLVWFCIVFDFVGLCLVLLDCVWFCWVVFGLVMYCVWFCQFVCDFEFFCDSFGFVFAFSFICLYLVLVCVLYGLVFAFGFVDLRLIWFILVWFGLVWFGPYIPEAQGFLLLHKKNPPNHLYSKFQKEQREDTLNY